jgi:hypothetical protein
LAFSANALETYISVAPTFLSHPTFEKDAKQYLLLEQYVGLQ